MQHNVLSGRRIELSDENKGNLYILMAALLWSTGGVLIKFVPWGAIVINGLRSLIAMFFFVAVRRSIKLKLNKTVVTAGIAMFLTMMLYVVANKMTTAANAIVLQYMSPMFVLIMQCIQSRRAPTVQQIGVLGVAFSGMVLFFCDKLDMGHMFGNLAAILSGVAFAAVFFLNSQPEADNGSSSIIGFALSFLVSIPMLFTDRIDFSFHAVAAILALGVFQIGLAYYMFGKGAKLTEPVKGSLISLIEAVLNPLWVFLIIGERPGNFALLGGILIIGAIVYNILCVKTEYKK